MREEVPGLFWLSYLTYLHHHFKLGCLFVMLLTADHCLEGLLLLITIFEKSLLSCQSFQLLNKGILVGNPAIVSGLALPEENGTKLFWMIHWLLNRKPCFSPSSTLLICAGHKNKDSKRKQGQSIPFKGQVIFMTRRNSSTFRSSVKTESLF